jgi:hypothetical protein
MDLSLTSQGPRTKQPRKDPRSKRNSDEFPPNETSRQRSGTMEQPHKSRQEVDKKTTRNEPEAQFHKSFSTLRKEDLEFPGRKVAESSRFWNEYQLPSTQKYWRSTAGTRIQLAHARLKGTPPYKKSSHKRAPRPMQPPVTWTNSFTGLHDSRGANHDHPGLRSC